MMFYLNVCYLPVLKQVVGQHKMLSNTCCVLNRNVTHLNERSKYYDFTDNQFHLPEL